MEIRPPTQEESKAVHDLRMLGLQETPEAFSSTYEESLTITEESITKRYLPREDHLTLCAFADGQPVGMIGLVMNDRIKTRHSAGIVGMFVAPEHRRMGIAQALVEAAINHAKGIGRIEQVSLEVTISCEPAYRLYQRSGFTQIGLVPRALRQGDEYHDTAIMQLDVRSGS